MASRVCVLGLDGLPAQLAHSLLAQGITPNLGRLKGFRSILAELPEISPVNWTSFMTGCKPAEHGIFGFSQIDADYSLHLSSFEHVAVPTIFDTLGAQGISSRVINLPNTYPARPFAGMKGMLVSGFVAHSLESAVYPPFLLGALRGAGYLLEAETRQATTNPHALLQGLYQSLNGRRAALHLLWPDLAWNLFVLVLTETDRLFHFLWDAVEDAQHPLHDACLDFLRAWDALIGEFLNLVEALPHAERPRLIVLADHGFTRLKTEFDLNAWLLHKGYLHLSRPCAQLDELELKALSNESSAFALDPGRIYIHTRRRFSRGTVPDSQRDEWATRIRRELLVEYWQGQPLFQDIFLGTELYAGAQQAYAPDLVCLPVRGIDLKAKFNRSTCFGHFGRTGTHTANDAFFYDSEASDTHCVSDVGRSILEHFRATLLQ